MTRKDTILIAVVINAGLLAILFTTAVIYDTDKNIEHTEFVTSPPENKILQVETPPTLIAAANSIGDEVDNVLKYYSNPSHSVLAEKQDSYVEPITIHTNVTDEEELNHHQDKINQDRFIEVKIKKGDMLEKIARANKTTVDAIKEANHLQNEKLSIGQILKIPVKPGSNYVVSPTTNQKAEIKQEKRKENVYNEPVYYVVKSGDNPWKIAKQFNVKYEEILRLNQLDEDKARNLKIGDRIRVK